MNSNYIYLGSNNKNFDEKFTRSHFKLKEKLNPYEKKMLSELSYFDENFNHSFLLRKLDGTDFSKEDTYKLLHCYLYDKVFINNSYRYCISCKYFTKHLISFHNE